MPPTFLRDPVVPSVDPPNSQTYVQGFGKIPSYRGDIPSPLNAMWYVPDNVSELFKINYPASEIRGWLKEAAAYHGVPLELAAVILQMENPPEHGTVRKVLQFGERSLTTFLAIVDDHAFDLVPDKIGSLHIAEGTSGIANMRRQVVRDAADYVEKTLGRPVIPDDVRSRVFGWNQDTRIPGDDLKADFYYLTAHLRQLIDRETGTKNYSGTLSVTQIQNIADRYVGEIPNSCAWPGKHATSILQNAAAGREPLYFYET